LRRDAAGLHCPTKNCQWENGVPEPPKLVTRDGCSSPQGPIECIQRMIGWGAGFKGFESRCLCWCLRCRRAHHGHYRLVRRK